MKKPNVILTTSTVTAIVVGALAFKAFDFPNIRQCTVGTPCGSATCPQWVFSLYENQ
jgi:hypothetical protein